MNTTSISAPPAAPAPPADPGVGFLEVSAASAYDRFIEPTATGVQVGWPSLADRADAILSLTAEDWAGVADDARRDDRVHQAIHDALWDALVDHLARRPVA